MATKLVPLEITFPIQGYAEGEVAGFAPEIAQRLIDADVAKPYVQAAQDVVDKAPEEPPAHTMIDNTAPVVRKRVRRGVVYRR